MQPRRILKPAAALLAALACAALVAVGATPARGQEGAAAAGATAPLTRRHLRGMETTIAPPAGGNVTVKGLAEAFDTALAIWNTGTAGVENAREWAAGVCNYGNWCGEGCPAPDRKSDPPTVDDVDAACKKHDECYGTKDPCQRCICHAQLVDDIHTAVGRMDCLGDNLFSDRCQEIQAVKEAPSISFAIKDIKMLADNCGDYAWRDGCPSSSSSSSASESSESTSSSSQSYRYTFTLATSCDSGSGTDGAGKVKVTDSNGAWYRTSELNNAGNDRETCSVDTYERDSEYKVLLNSDTTCEVYFEPKGLYPNWKVDYVKVARSSDSEETKSAKFCTSGTLSSEGWHTFYFCD